jgi:Ca-activated chloride channel family protein
MVQAIFRRLFTSSALIASAFAIGSLTGCSSRSEAATEALQPGFLAPAEMMRSDLKQPGMPEALAIPQVQTPDEELWVIEKKQSALQERDASIPGTGALVAKLPDNPTETVPVPLKHTDVKASIAGYIATVEVQQQFHNPFSSKIEAVYVFPLPENAAVNEFVMTVGTRKIRGIIRERQEAERIYQAAKSQGYVASLMTQERPNIFTQSVANIEPGKEIDVDVKYFHTLAYSDGWYQFVFPMVVGPRFNPSASTEGVGAVARGAYGSSGQKTEVQYLAPNERSGHDISLAVHLDAGVPVEAIECKTHEIQKSDGKGGAVDVKLAASDSLPNRDFVLRYKVAGRTIKSAVVVQRDEGGKGGFFTLMLVPPETQRDLPRKPLEMVFTIDVSGSQSGIPLSQEKAAVKYAITHMNAGDTFQVIRFGNQAIKLFAKPQPADDAHVSRAIHWIDALDANEGTMLVDGLRASLLFPHDEQRLRYVTFLTDGFIGNEAEAFAEIHQDLGPSRIFSFGSGSSTNRYLLEGMAKMGSGAAAYLGPRADAEEVMAEFLKRISRPAMTELSIDFGGIKVSDVYPARLGDLYVGKPVTISGRFKGGGKHTIKLKGVIAGEKREIPIAVNFDGATQPGIGAVWARMKIADLAERSTYEPVADLTGQIKSTALEFGLMSSFTAFVAVDSTEKTAGDHGTSVAVPVPVPEGVRYETTVSGPER